jgi:hypothetical protein
MSMTTAGIVLAALLVLGCATTQEWSEWTSHGAHFASASHMGFSVRNREGGATRVTRADLNVARDQQWWGQPITVDQTAVLER